MLTTFFIFRESKTDTGCGRSIKGPLRLPFAPMAHPESITDLARRRGTTVRDITIPCGFCNEPLNDQDKYAFDVRNHRLLNRRGVYFGCCTPCVRALARKDRDTGNLAPFTVAEAEAYVGKNIGQILVLCSCCLKRLDLIEKLIHQRAGFYLCMVRDGEFRGICRLCMVLEGQE
ncbi:E6 [Eidolon helvum papillomavirus 2]|uniref:Protein E6 n=1 Tax=Eidolon helvum papillomavirus 2 TaxID=1335476 RepID=A0A1P8YVV8_9PAPI|nr:E6 [Eidolon helvum papillomavirus 2]AQA28215.1 E6 [Eidolon helvum papillomavirus 2]